MLNYLFQFFHERDHLLTMFDKDVTLLDRQIKNQCAPKPSYEVIAPLTCSSYFGAFSEQSELHFFATGQRQWLIDLKAEQIETGLKAQAYFESRCAKAFEQFRQTEIAQHAQNVGCEKLTSLSKQRRDETWRHFLDGTYGVCTTDGLPETIVLKQTLVSTIDRFLQRQQKKNNDVELESLLKVVNALDQVEPPFAPHERLRSSRQRCIVNVRATYLKS
ncbi:DUF6058 family natural product biosynthesis protein [Maritalea porphyrae]|uniref:DUF6058 family natural product biosynthesis protein n=1 Tax=Maritalea porphyrae TaxID=880732 RepID=UPI0022B07CCB|nr:DUF6058 family natural product biosynthesis protein [Maritalea porphyrae]MCZ4272346.1 DUF6058 family natural product biosynthesis protein [Maritalea porphyrae]